MAASDPHLLREIATIVNSPYPVSPAASLPYLHVCCHLTADLGGQKLASILCTKDALTIRACIGQLPPCALAVLARNVYEALPMWQGCLDLVQRLCTCAVLPL